MEIELRALQIDCALGIHNDLHAVKVIDLVVLADLLVEVDRIAQTGASAAFDAEAEAAFFESKIRPLLVAHCLDCHAGAEAEGGLNLESRAGWQRGGDSGPAIAIDPNGRGSSAESLLYKAVSYADRRIKMPPDGRLSQREIDDLKTWIDGGAFDPRTEAAAPARQDPASRYDELLVSHWAYLPRQPAAATATIDSLVHGRPREAGLEIGRAHV